jgi:hypothetical protein
MPRSVGITLSAVVVFIGSAFTILCGVMMVFASALFLLSDAGQSAKLPAHFSYFAIIEAVVIFGFGGWGVASGVGLIKTKQWARISMLIYATILVFIGLPAALMMAFIRLPNSSDPNLPSNFMGIIQGGIALFYGMLAALGGFWLYFFNRRSVKTQFLEERPVVGIPVPGLPLAISQATYDASQRVRPLSISIIGWFLLIGSAFTPLCILFYSALLPSVQFPFCFLGFFLFGRNAFLILLFWMGVQVMAAVGLLKLRNWGRLTTIGLQFLTLTNFALVFGITANRVRFQQLMETMSATVDANMHQSVPFVFPAWIGAVVSLPIVFAVLWFLITEKHAFGPSGHALARERP